MVDVFSKSKRSEVMSLIKGKNTKPEKLVRSLLHGLGYRFRLNCKNLPGKPDICLPKYMTVVFVHGCFWHRHAGCNFAYTPKTRRAFWQKKFDSNVIRDREVKRQITSLGWRHVIVWECELKNVITLQKRLLRMLAAD
jgi:DNA mismatch endonuclease (patch repair protein)